jgi:hypothetical protein
MAVARPTKKNRRGDDNQYQLPATAPPTNFYEESFAHPSQIARPPERVMMATAAFIGSFLPPPHSGTATTPAEAPS